MRTDTPTRRRVDGRVRPAELTFRAPHSSRDRAHGFAWLVPLLLGCLLAALAGCTTPKGQLVVGTVGPQNPRGSTSGGFGQLQVFTQTVQNNDGGIIYPIHSGYWIYATNGFKVKSVLNHVGPTDMSPMVVVLPAGTYHIIARADRYGIITVPAVIEGNRMTQIYLDSTGFPAVLEADQTNLVHLPGGPAIGFRAAASSAPVVKK